MECLTVGKCSIDPRTIALSETFIYETRLLTYYILKIKELGYENISIVNIIIETLASINFGFDYKQKDIEELLTDLHEKRKEVVTFYKNICISKNLDCQMLHSLQPSDDDLNFIKAIMAGEKQSIKRNTQISSCKKNLYEIMIMLAKTVSSIITKLADYDITCMPERYKTLEFLNSLNFLNIRKEKLVKKILQFSRTNYELSKLLNETYEKTYGKTTIQNVSFDKIKGKAILISGDNYNDLDLLLQATEEKDINIYTHDMMLLAQQYPHFQRYPHLKGQFQYKDNNIQMDFSSFPGPILLSRDYTNKLDSIYRGNLFSTDKIPGKNLRKINNYDFAPLIKAANTMEGFTKYEEKISIRLGYNSDELELKIEDLCEKINNNKLKDIYIVGLLNYGYHSDTFFEKLYEKIGTENFIISLAYEKKAENIFHIQSFFDFTLIYKLIEKLYQNIDTTIHSIKMILTQCTNATITNFFILKELGIEDIYITCCNVNTLNPAIIECLKKQFNVKQLFENSNKEIEL